MDRKEEDYHERSITFKRLLCRVGTKPKNLAHWLSVTQFQEGFDNFGTGGDTDALLLALSQITAKLEPTALSESHSPQIRLCFEAGYDGFWLARFLLDRGVDTTTLDPSSLLVSRRGRRVKTIALMLWQWYPELKVAA